jgi:cell division septum initiation protein DivIVA
MIGSQREQERRENEFEARIVRKLVVYFGIFFGLYAILAFFVWGFIVMGILEDRASRSVSRELSDGLNERLNNLTSNFEDHFAQISEQSEEILSDLEERNDNAQDILDQIQRQIAQANRSIETLEQLRSLAREEILENTRQPDLIFRELETLITRIDRLDETIPTQEEAETHIRSVLHRYFESNPNTYYRGQFSYQVQQIVDLNHRLIEQVTGDFRDILSMNSEYTNSQIEEIRIDISEKRTEYESSFLTADEAYEIMIVSAGAIGGFAIFLSLGINLFLFSIQKQFSRSSFHSGDRQAETA